jgi:hypothetical protein
LKYKKYFAMTLALICFNTFAFKIYATLTPENSPNDNYLLITIYDRNCTNEEFNSKISNSTRSFNACWTQDNENVKITNNESKEIRIIPFQDFKYMGESSPAKVSSVQTKESKVTLTCVADAWAGDILIERNKDGSITNFIVSGEQISPTEQGNSINFSYKGLNISLSTLTGVFNYETSGFQKYLNNRLLGGGSTKGAGACKVNNNQKMF